MRGQFLSMDFLVAIVIITISLGLFTQSFETAQKNSAQANMSINPAEVIAEQMTNVCRQGPPVPPDPTKKCNLLPGFCYRFYVRRIGDPTPSPIYTDLQGLTDIGDTWVSYGGMDCVNPSCGTVFAAKRLVECPFAAGGAGVSTSEACLLEVKTCG
ncbi:MAG: hypothetical protein V1811_01120 [Candidatus Micrarchaeota archaeon]